MHHGTCVTRELRCLSGSLTRGGGENVPGIPGACATRNFTYLVRGPWIEGSYNASAVWSKAFINSRRWQAVAGLCDLWSSRCWRRYSSHRCNRYRVRGLQKAKVHVNAHKKALKKMADIADNTREHIFYKGKMYSDADFAELCSKCQHQSQFRLR